MGGVTRLFVAIVPPDAVKDAAAQFPRVPGVKPVRRDQLHVTLRFVADFPEEGIEALVERLARIGAPRLDLTVGPWGRFGHRVVWLDVTPVEPVLALADAVDAAVRAQPSVPRREQTFRPHLTVARLSSFSPVRARQLLEAAPALEPMRWSVTEMVLVKSRLSPQGATHTPLATFALEPP